MKKPRTRIQEKNSAAILEAALDVFSQAGFRGATLDQIADVAGLSKPNLLYYFSSKEDIHQILLTSLLDTWLDPLREMDASGKELAAADRIADVELIERDVGIQQDEIIPLDVVGEIGHIARSRSQRRRDAHQIGETGTGRRPVGRFIPVKRPGVDVVPSVVGGACGVGPGDGKERGGDHQGRAGKKGTGLRTFHFNKFGEVTGK